MFSSRMLKEEAKGLTPASRSASKPVWYAYPAIVNFTTASLEPAAASSGWKSGSLPITLTPTMVQFAAVVWAGWPGDVLERKRWNLINKKALCF